MGYDRGDSFPFDFEPDGVPFSSKSKGKLSPRPYPVQFERNWNTSFVSVQHKFEFYACVNTLIEIHFWALFYLTICRTPPPHPPAPSPSHPIPKKWPNNIIPKDEQMFHCEGFNGQRGKEKRKIKSTAYKKKL